MRALGFAVKKKDVLAALHNHGCGQDHTAEVEFDDFASIMKNMYLGRDYSEVVEKAFGVFDTEHEGKITFKSLKKVVKSVGEDLKDECLADMIEMFDKDGDGAINMEEFRKIMKEYDPLEDDW
jgi:Ca2+-binding EF-hand superfamily protein